MRQYLPAYIQRHEIIHCVGAAQVTLVSGSSGSGKTTQIPQVMLDMTFFAGKRIVCVSKSALLANATSHK
eukprot:gene11317-17387_t